MEKRWLALFVKRDATKYGPKLNYFLSHFLTTQNLGPKRGLGPCLAPGTTMYADLNAISLKLSLRSYRQKHNQVKIGLTGVPESF